jgi:hypothetical protein
MEEKKDPVQVALKKAEMMAGCLSHVMDFIASEGLEEKAVAYLKKVKDPYFLRFMREKGGS